jgi:hypothetical protein
MDLALQQTELLSLVKRGHTVGENADPYIRKVAQSEHLCALRETILWWRTFDIQRCCRLTASLLKQRGMFEDTVTSFAAQANLSPFVEQLADEFLQQMSGHHDPLVAAVAQFELYLTKVKLGDTAEYTVHWPTDPWTLITSLAENQLRGPLTSQRYQMRISRQCPGLVHICAG